MWLESYRDDDREKGQEAAKLYYDALEMLQRFVSDNVDYIRAVFGIYEAYSKNDTINIGGGVQFPFLRQQKKNEKK